MDTVILDPVIPYVGPIGGDSFSPKKLIKLETKVPPRAYGFDINLQCGTNTFPHDDIALQISARFLNGYITLNSLHEGIWGKEIRLSNVLIDTDQKFKITVLCEFNQYKVTFNDEHYCIFPQRIRCEKVSHLSIDGDVSIIRISYESIFDSISDTATLLPSTINQFIDVEHSDSPPSYDTVVDHTEDVESQNVRIASVAIFQIRRNTSSTLKATVKSGCKILFIFFFIIAIFAVSGYIIYLINQYGQNDTGDTGFTYDIPPIDFKNYDIYNMNMKMNDVSAELKKIDETNKFFSNLHIESNIRPEII